MFLTLLPYVKIYTVYGMSLARISMVDWNEDVVLDLHVHTSHDKVVDYNTTYSGITRDTLAKPGMGCG